MSHSAGPRDFFLNKTNNINSSHAESGLFSFGKNCKQGRPWKTVWFHNSREQCRSQTDAHCSTLHLSYLTLCTLLLDFPEERYRRQELCHSLTSTLRQSQCQLHACGTSCTNCQLLLAMCLDFCISILCPFPFFSCSCPSAVTEVTILQCWQSGPLHSGLQYWCTSVHYMSVCIRIHFTF